MPLCIPAQSNAPWGMGHSQRFDAHTCCLAFLGALDSNCVQTVVLVPSCGPFSQRLFGQGSWLLLFAPEPAGEVEVLVA